MAPTFLVTMFLNAAQFEHPLQWKLVSEVFWEWIYSFDCICIWLRYKFGCRKFLGMLVISKRLSWERIYNEKLCVAWTLVSLYIMSSTIITDPKYGCTYKYICRSEKVTISCPFNTWL